MKLHSLVRFTVALFALFFFLEPRTNFAKETQPYRVVFEDGTALVLEVENIEFTWNTISEDGKVTPRRQRMHDVLELRLAKTTVSEEVAQVKQLIDQLNAPRYGVREAAEKKLRQVAGPYQEILKKRQETGNAEARIRLKRIIKHFSRQSRTSKASFDILSVANGKVTRGDCPNLKIVGQFYGNELAIDRKGVVRVSRQKQGQSGKNKFVAGFHATASEPSRFYTDKMKTVDFETGKAGVRMQIGDDISAAYVYLGCRMMCEPSKSGKSNDNRVEIDGYDVRGRTPGKSGVCLDQDYDSPKYKGRFRVHFCMPGQPGLNSSTKRVGAYLQMINVPRTIVLEAYNSDDECVGICEAIESTSFVGIESDDPISYIRIKTNEYIVASGDTELDNDFAVDDLTFSEPQPDLTSGYDKDFAVTLSRGDVIRCSDIKFEDGQVKLIKCAVLNRDMTVPAKKVLSIVTPREKQKSRETRLNAFARTQAGSVLAINKIGDKAVVDFPSFELKKDAICGIWGAKTLCRHANRKDYKSGKQVVVFPTLRLIVDRVELADNKVSWGQSKSEIAKQTMEKFEDIDDPRHEKTFSLADSPSIWFRAPDQPQKGTGMIRLTDKQRFVLGEGQFQLSDLSRDAVTIRFGEDKISVPMTQVRSIIFPTNKK